MYNMSNPRISNSKLVARYSHLSNQSLKTDKDIKTIRDNNSYAITLSMIRNAFYKKPSLSINRMYAGCLHEMDNKRRCNCRNKHTTLVLELMNTYLHYNYMLEKPITFIQFYTANKRNSKLNMKLYDTIEIDACIKLCKLYPDLQRHTIYIKATH